MLVSIDSSSRRLSSSPVSPWTVSSWGITKSISKSPVGRGLGGITSRDGPATGIAVAEVAEAEGPADPFVFEDAFDALRGVFFLVTTFAGGIHDVMR